MKEATPKDYKKVLGQVLHHLGVEIELKSINIDKTVEVVPPISVQSVPRISVEIVPLFCGV